MSNLEFVYRYADGEVARLPGLADELARLRPRAIVCGSTSATLAARAAAADTPIVSAVLTDPVLFGLAASHSQPGGNVTGVLNNVETLPEKQFELLLEMVPAAERIGFVVNLSNPSNVLHQATAERAAKRLAFQSTVVKLRTADDLPRAFEELVQARVQIALFLADAMFLASRRRIAETALTAGLPIVYSLREHVEDGGLMSYGVDLGESWRYAGRLLNKILNGAKPADLPIEFPTKLELVVNARTAKALNLTIPPQLLARADEVIE